MTRDMITSQFNEMMRLYEASQSVKFEDLAGNLREVFRSEALKIPVIDHLIQAKSNLTKEDLRWLNPELYEIT